MTVNDENSVYVGGLAYEATEEQVRKAFKEFGEIVAVKIVQGHDGHSRGYGFVTYSTPEAANDAICGMSGKVIAGRSVKVNEARNRMGDRNMTRESSHRDRDRDRDGRKGRDSDRDRDRDKGRDRYSPKRSRKSPLRSGRERSPEHKRHRSSRNGRSRTRSNSPASFNGRDRREKADKYKASKGGTVNNVKLKEDLAKAIESQHCRRDEVANFQAELERAGMSIQELRNREMNLEATLAKASAALKERIEFFKKIRLAFLEVRDCQNKLKTAEAELQDLLLGISPDIPGDEEAVFAYANGDVNHDEDIQRTTVSP